jgi:excisionase family DNA binding protein
MFYKTPEAAEKLGVTADQLKEMVAQGKLREFRDGNNVMFKVDQVDRLAGDKGGTKSPGRPAGSDSGIDLAASDTGTTDSLNLSDTGAKEDTRLTNLEGSSVFAPGEVKSSDPKSKTDVPQDAVSIEGVGSGSGLLDLTRESDETSLGAELLDEIYPGGEGKAEGGIGSASGIFEQGAAAESGSASGLENMSAGGASTAPMVGAVEYVEAGDAASGAFGGLSFAAILVMVLTFVAVGSVAAGYVPGWVNSIAETTTNTLIFAAILLVVALAAAGVGYFVSKAAAR